MNFEDTGREYLNKVSNSKSGRVKSAGKSKRTAARLLAKTIVRTGMGAAKLMHSGYCAVGAGVKAYSAVKEEVEQYRIELIERKLGKDENDESEE